MKKQFLSMFALLLVTVSLHATVRTVSNHPNGGAQYSTLTDAYNASSSGDTLLIEGTDLTYFPYFGSGVDWAKSLVVIGAGFNPGSTTGKRTKITSTQSFTDLQFGSGMNGSKFYGIEFLTQVSVAANISNMEFAECKFDGNMTCNASITATNFTFSNCVFDNDGSNNVDMNSSATATWNFFNCIFDNTIYGSGLSTAVFTFDHCIFLKTGSNIFDNVKSPVVMNSFFVNSSVIANATTTGGVFTNNIARMAVTLPPAGNTGSGNLVSTDPMFTTYTNGANYSASYDFNLQAASAGNNAATDGTDIGVHGGSSTFSESGEPLIVPIIRTMTVLNASVESGGTLNVSITAGKPSED